jgi:hypothetical protein
LNILGIARYTKSKAGNREEAAGVENEATKSETGTEAIAKL